MRVLGGALVAVGVGTLLFAISAQAGIDARVAGPFDVEITATKGNIQQPGREYGGTWRFKPRCETGPCDRIRLHRELPGHGEAKSTLSRIAAGVYRGTERLRVRCPHARGH